MDFSREFIERREEAARRNRHIIRDGSDYTYCGRKASGLAYTIPDAEYGADIAAGVLLERHFCDPCYVSRRLCL